MHACSFSHDTTINHMSVRNSQKSIVKQTPIGNHTFQKQLQRLPLLLHSCKKKKRKPPLSLNHDISLHSSTCAKLKRLPLLHSCKNQRKPISLNRAIRLRHTCASSKDYHLWFNSQVIFRTRFGNMVISFHYYGCCGLIVRTGLIQDLRTRLISIHLIFRVFWSNNQSISKNKILQTSIY